MNENKKRFLAILLLLLSLLLLCSSCGKSKAHDKVANDTDVIRLGVPSNGLGRETESEEVIEIQKKEKIMYSQYLFINFFILLHLYYYRYSVS